MTSARSYVGTPFHHQGRTPGSGLDCAGVVLCAARDNGLLSAVDRSGYDRHADGSLQTLLDSCLLNTGQALLEGSVLLFWFDRRTRVPHHLGLCTEVGTMIHAFSYVKKVCEVPLDRYWLDRLICTYDFPEYRTWPQ